MIGRLLYSRLAAFGVSLLAAALGCPRDAKQPSQDSSSAAGCRVASDLSRLPELPEASGIAASQRTPGVLWSHNDSGEPVVFALTSAGAVSGHVRVTRAKVVDWEAVAVGTCPQGTCLYVADIGDNNARRPAITIYRTREPAPGEAVTAPAEALHATYPDGPQDAEAFILLPDGTMLIVTKGDTGPVVLYRFPSPFQNGATVSLQRVVLLVPAVGKGKRALVAKPDRITDAGASPDGRWIVLRTNRAIRFYEAREFAAGQIRAVYQYDVGSVREPQGEGVALTTNGTVWLAGEGGGKGLPGSFARLTCVLE